MGVILIRLAYGIMIAGIFMCFILSRNHQRDLRKAAGAFAFTFARLSNHVSPRPPKAGLQTETVPGGGVRVLPAERQTEAMRAIINRAGSKQSVELFAQLDDSAALVAKRVGINRTHKAQFQEPIDRMLLLAQTFLVGCENLETIDTLEKREAFNCFLTEQPQYRMLLLKRIPGDQAEEYRSLNKNYAREMERIEEEERQARQKRKGGKPKSDAPKPKDVSTGQEPPEAAAAAEIPAPAAEQPAQEESLRDRCRGCGCG